jgi:BASS family bile acid:Na+ symporter
MDDSALLDTLLPIALGVIMLGLGLSLTLADFKRVVRFPRAVGVGLACQMILLPIVCFGIAHLFGLAPALAVGLMLLAASPGGATANLFSHLSHGDVALNITLTAINSVLSLVTLPLIVNFSIQSFMGSGDQVTLVLSKVLEVFAIVLIPIAIGMAIKARAPGFAKRMDKPARIVSAIFLILVVLGAILEQRENIGPYFAAMGLACLAFNLVSMATGFWVPKLFGVVERQRTAIAMEIGIHNGTLAIFLANNVLENTEMAIPAAVYSIIMFFTAGGFAYLMAKRNARTEAAMRVPVGAPD